MKTAEEWLSEARRAIDRSRGADQPQVYESDLEESVAAFEQVLALEPVNHEALRERGAVLLQLDRCDEALDSFIAAASQRAPDAALQLEVANALARIKHFERSLAAYEEVLRVDPREAKALVGRAEALSALGRNAAAIAAWDEAIAVLEVRQVEHQGKRIRDLSDDDRAQAARAARDQVLGRLK